MGIKLDIAKYIIYEDKDIIICHKPAGIAVQTARPGEADMESALKNYLHSPYIGIIHRLDQPVEGLLVFAKNQKAAGALSRQNQGMSMSKIYYAVAAINDMEADVELQKERVLLHYLVKDGKTNTSKVAAEKTREAKKAELVYQVMQTGDSETALIRIQLKTGRHHQIRVQLSHIGMPLLGDGKYGSGYSKELSRNKNIKNVALCACSLSFFHPDNKKKMEFMIEPAGEAFIPFLPINP